MRVYRVLFNSCLLSPLPSRHFSAPRFFLEPSSRALPYTCIQTHLRLVLWLSSPEICLVRHTHLPGTVESLPVWHHGGQQVMAL